MKLSKRQMILVAGLLLTLVGLGAERLQLLPASVGPRQAEASVGLDVTGPADADAGPARPAARAPAWVQNALADRLTAAAKAHRVDLDNVKDAFVPAADWAGCPSAELPPPDSPEVKARRFVRDHRLEATVAGADGDSAIVDGRCMAVGAELDGFRLVSVTCGSSVWDCDGRRVTLRLAVEAPAGEASRPTRGR